MWTWSAPLVRATMLIVPSAPSGKAWFTALRNRLVTTWPSGPG